MLAKEKDRESDIGRKGGKLMEKHLQEKQNKKETGIGTGGDRGGCWLLLHPPTVDSCVGYLLLYFLLLLSIAVFFLCFFLVFYCFLLFFLFFFCNFSAFRLFPISKAFTSFHQKFKFNCATTLYKLYKISILYIHFLLQSSFMSF